MRQVETAILLYKVRGNCTASCAFYIDIIAVEVLHVYNYYNGGPVNLGIIRATPMATE